MDGWASVEARICGACPLRMSLLPGKSFSGRPPPLTMEGRSCADRLGADLDDLVRGFGPRHLGGRERALTEAAVWLERRLQEAGLGPRRERFQAGSAEVFNVLAEPPAVTPEAPVLLVGAHYDTVPGSPGANDNGSGVVAVLELARRFARRPTRNHLRFVLFVNEEAPWFMSPAMGSLVHARGCLERGERLLGMLCLESVGVYIDLPGSQRYPPPLDRLYPDRGDFIAFVGNMASSRLLWGTIGSFRARASLPSEGLLAPEWALREIGRSDHKAFWSCGYPAVMLTDTANFRDTSYHTPLDRPGNLDLESMARMLDGLEAVILDRMG